ERLDRLVALKLVPESVNFDASAQEDLKRETRKSLLLTHPNIVRIFDFVEDEHSAAISMEYVDGATFSSLRVKKPNRCFEVDEIASLVTALCDALSYAHESAGLVHRDLKPANLMVNSRNELKITDFGIACTLRDSFSHASAPTSSGTLNYMSPQQLLGEDPSASDDIYAVGATLYEMLSSKPPFYGGDVASQVREVIPPTIAQRRAKLGVKGSSIPKHWEETIAACLAKEAERRPRTAADVARRFRLGGTVRLRHAAPAKFDFAKILAAIREKFRAVERIAALLGGGMALAGALLVVFHNPNPHLPEPASADVAQAQRAPHMRPSASRDQRPSVVSVPRTLGFATEKPEAVATTPPPPPSTKNISIEINPAAQNSGSPPPTASTVENATIALTTNPSGANFAVYSGVIAGKPPTTAPFRSGTAPDSVVDLPPGRYTLFFHHDGWPDDRTEVSLSAGESIPLDYTFPHGSATITSSPDGAEIFFGKRSLGIAPLTVDLPLGKHTLNARLPNMSDRTEIVSIDANAHATVKFQLRAATRSSSRAKPTPTPPSALDKVGQSFKHLFGGGKDPTPAPRKRPSN
ncbi:MAG: serine/threonine protein kinase, partial [Verrucomicrobia bacterium]|nr:serine/threonine protein kinase [Verrucomicrobiota bacterium]